MPGLTHRLRLGFEPGALGDTRGWGLGHSGAHIPGLWVFGAACRACLASGFGVVGPLGLALGISIQPYCWHSGVQRGGLPSSPSQSLQFCLRPLAGALGSREEPEFVTARAGESVILGCDVIHPLTGQPPPYVVEWFKFGVPIPIFIKFGFYPPHVDPGYAGEDRRSPFPPGCVRLRSICSSVGSRVRSLSLSLSSLSFHPVGFN